MAKIDAEIAQMSKEVKMEKLKMAEKDHEIRLTDMKIKEIKTLTAPRKKLQLKALEYKDVKKSMKPLASIEYKGIENQFRVKTKKNSISSAPYVSSSPKMQFRIRGK